MARTPRKTAPAPAPTSASNASADPTQSLQSFDLQDLQPYTLEKQYSPNASRDFHLFYVGRDDVHDILKHVLSRVSVSLYMNMFGYDDDELNDIVMAKAMDPRITVLITLDRSQAGGPHEKRLLDSDIARDPTAYNTHFVVGTSATHQISHTKGFVADGRVAAEGSTNFSASGEGTFIVTGVPGGAGYQAQNNTQSVITDPDTIHRFQAKLIAEHLAAQALAKAGPPAGHSAASAASRVPPLQPALPAARPASKLAAPTRKRAASSGR